MSKNPMDSYIINQFFVSPEKWPFWHNTFLIDYHFEYGRVITVDEPKIKNINNISRRNAIKSIP